MAEGQAAHDPGPSFLTPDVVKLSWPLIGATQMILISVVADIAHLIPRLLIGPSARGYQGLAIALSDAQQSQSRPRSTVD